MFFRTRSPFFRCISRTIQKYYYENNGKTCPLSLQRPFAGKFQVENTAEMSSISLYLPTDLVISSGKLEIRVPRILGRYNPINQYSPNLRVKMKETQVYPPLTFIFEPSFLRISHRVIFHVTIVRKINRIEGNISKKNWSPRARS